jgi:uncharacterized membrane protein YccC
MQWQRGLRAGVAVGMAMVVCHALGHPMGWAALGGLQVVMVDNGGPYRSRLANMLTVLVGGSLAVGLGVMAGINLPLAEILTFAFCFAVTLSRVLSQPLASSSVVILVCYIVAHGSAVHTRTSGLIETRDFLLGGLWAATLTFGLWPADPFRPARHAVASVYETLTELLHLLPSSQSPETTQKFNETLAKMRVQMEDAHQSIAATPARMTARTVRARNLSVLLESADLLLARVLRFAELGQELPLKQPATQLLGLHAEASGVSRHLARIATWLQESLAPIAPALRNRPAQGISTFEPYGAQWAQMHRAMENVLATLEQDRTDNSAPYLEATVRESMLHVEVSYAALCAVWSGVETRATDPAQTSVQPTKASLRAGIVTMWDSFYAHWSLSSVMFRHALRLSIVVCIDIAVTHILPFSHGYWLAMTSLIVLQPRTGETVRRSGERVLGTVAGAGVAAIIAAAIHSQTDLIVAVSIGSALTIAMYAVDYAWYCFFLTPTIVLMTLPHLRDWHFAAIRMGMTLLGAAVAVAAMLLLWPERESLELPGLLARAADAEAAYARATIAFWRATCEVRGVPTTAERRLLSPARRNCGLATNDAEEMLDRALIEHAIPLNPERARTEKLNHAALSFTTYLRRLTQTITSLAATGDTTFEKTVEAFAARLDRISQLLNKKTADVDTGASKTTDATTEAPELIRMERQISVLERTAMEMET